jgi:hypothetical protein
MIETPSAKVLPGCGRDGGVEPLAANQPVEALEYALLISESAAMLSTPK